MTARQTAWLLILMGCPGILSLMLALPPSHDVPRVALLIQPALLLVVFAFAGNWAAARCGFRGFTRAGAWRRFQEATLGLLLGLVLAFADQLAHGLWQAAPGRPPSLIEGWRPTGLAIGMLYGGVVEEIVFRWGAMSLLTFGLWRALARHARQPPAACIMAALAVTAILFAAGHLPALFAAGDAPGPGIIARTLLLNFIAGIAFGVLYARRDLAAAMSAHACTHAGIALAVLMHTAR